MRREHDEASNPRNDTISEEIVPRLRNPELAAPVCRLRSIFINGVKEMRVRFDPVQ